MKPEIQLVKCNHCDWVGSEDDLRVEGDIEFCPNCRESEYLMDVDINDPVDLKKIQLTWLASVREELEEWDPYICLALVELARPLYFTLNPAKQYFDIDDDNLSGWEPLDFLLRKIKQKIGGCETVEMYLGYPEPTDAWDIDEGFSDVCRRFRIQIVDELIVEVKNET